MTPAPDPRRARRLRQHRRAEGRRPRRQRGRDRHADRRQRRRQVDADDDDVRQAARARRHIVFDGRDITQIADPRDRAPAHRAVARRPPHLPAHDACWKTCRWARRAGDGGTSPSRPLWSACCTLFPLLEERLTQRGGTLSGGEQQMLAIGRALMSRPAPPAARRAVARPGAADRTTDFRRHPRA